MDKNVSFQTFASFQSFNPIFSLKTSSAFASLTLALKEVFVPEKFWKAKIYVGFGDCNEILMKDRLKWSKIKFFKVILKMSEMTRQQIKIFYVFL